MGKNFDEMIEHHVSTLDTEYIDSFRDLVSRSIDGELASIDANYESHKKMNYDDPEVQYMNYSWIEDDAIYMNDVSHLADELSIVALYKLFEKKHKELIAFHTKDYDMRKYSYWNNVLAVLPEDAKKLSSFISANELRLINNSIKHEGVVSDELSKHFPAHGNAGSELSGLDKGFLRLKPCVIDYINELHKIYKQQTT